MTNKKYEEKKCLIKSLNIEYFNSNLDVLINKLTTVKKEYSEYSSFEIHAEQYWDNVHIGLVGIRLETEEEYKARERREYKKKQRMEEKEREQYESLKKKYKYE